VRKAKYNAKKFIIDGMTFDSRKEADRYRYLRDLQAKGLISGLRCQVRYELIPAQYEPTGDVYRSGPRKGQHKMRLAERPVAYIADFVYNDGAGDLIVEDVKGFKGSKAYDLFAIKRKLMRYVHGIEVKEV